MDKTVGTRLRAARDAINDGNGMSLSRLCMDAEVPETTLRSWENGTREPKFSDDLGRVALRLGVTTDHLLGIEVAAVSGE